MQTVRDRLVAFLKKQHMPRSQVERRLGWANGYIVKFPYNPSDECLKQLLKMFPRLNLQWLLYGEGEMLRPNIDQPNNVPCVPEYADAGTLRDILEGKMPKDCKPCPIVRNQLPYHFTIKARGNSMRPVIMPSDELTCCFVANKNMLRWGQVHVLDTENGIFIGRVYDAGDSLRCSPCNPIYGDFLVPKASVLAIARMVGVIRIL